MCPGEECVEGPAADGREEEEEDSLKIIISVSTAASELQLPKLDTLELGSMSKHVKHLIDNGHSIPEAHKLHITRRFAIGHLAQGEIEKWAKAVDPSPADDGEWSVEMPQFRHCKGFSMPSESSEHTAAQSCFVKAVFCNPFLRNVFDCHETQNARDMMVKVVRAFLVVYMAGEKKLTEGIVEMCAPCVSAARGLLALVSPVPVDLGASLQDVSFILPKMGPPGLSSRPFPTSVGSW